MEDAAGLLRARVVRGVNLAKRDAGDSDAYVVLCLGDQKMKTNVRNNSLNPDWNEDLTFCVSDPTQPLKLEVYDKDTFTVDDKMGDAELDIQPFMDAIKEDWEGLRDGTIIQTVNPSSQNCLASDSRIIWKNDMVTQDIALRLRNVETGEVELQLLWVKIPRALDF
ncbi:protein C2-DOMAIN ABA-RELATED 7-like [Canna indica]|uniref:Protein C2-DOMAIN ABA-RELATED 7-like n=1 Tax=Canna indica TaxID=4628 RepID=A0AAQ3Q6T8_9LILI|nr:protein C2-DOMAIN ABA-RELATED 7-like [Canna indica]